MSIPLIKPTARIITAPFRLLYKKKVFILALLLIIVTVACVFLYWKYRSTAQQLLSTVNKDPNVELNQVVDQIGKLMILPSEKPTLATVTDKAVLEAQEFFQLAENGDKVLIYSEAKKVILFRPNIGKIVNVAPLINQPKSEQTTDQDTNLIPKTSVALLNGSAKVGITNVIDDQLVSNFPNVKISQKLPAAKNDYSQTVVIDLTGKNAELVGQIATELNAKVSTLPEGETTPTAEIVVIVGNQ